MNRPRQGISRVLRIVRFKIHICSILIIYRLSFIIHRFIHHQKTLASICTATPNSSKANNFLTTCP